MSLAKQALKDMIGNLALQLAETQEQLHIVSNENNTLKDEIKNLSKDNNDEKE